MAQTALDMTGPRPGTAVQVYAVYGGISPDTATMTELLHAGTVLRQVPLDLLVAADTGRPALLPPILGRLATHRGQPLAGVVGFDDWWTTALTALNHDFPLAAARRLVTDKAALYAALTAHGVATAPCIPGPLSIDLLTAALDRFGPAPILKPATGAGSRGVYRYQPHRSITDNLAVYQRLRELGHIDTSIPTIAAAYLGGDDALEISVDVIVCAGTPTHAVVHEKCTATAADPFVDQVMITPPVRSAIITALPELPATITGVITTLQLRDGVLHVELRLHEGVWHVLDVGVRPGSGLVSHAVHATTGVDPRLIHLAASIGRPVPPSTVNSRTGRHQAACIACCYLTDDRRDSITLGAQQHLADALRTADDVIGWHLNAADLDDQVYRPDAGLSIGIAAHTPAAAMTRLRTLVEPHGYTTT
ncbi:ATP-grasp domain-containing protein [Dactylosporangium sp. NPDC051485]|uniref:ATP-grasp domain-containing protein n=1 Tax=Dactylosporangium sp. NPDC051485 TaxID=3154846 RepID=UPI0034300B65